MEKIKKILAPTDLSELSEVGVRYALDLAKAVGAEVTLYHVVTYEELVKYGEVMTEKLAIGSTFQTSGSVLEKYERALARLIKERFSDLIPPVKV
ncbi:MAG TPA: universal stress protein, partial [Candidatus Binatia bacterium]|nr:universal stress protein [Candidatus Binatia bacterium]